MHLLRRRLALALVALAWLAQQVGFATHGPMQVGAALGGPLAEICTSTGLAPAPGDPASPDGHRTQGANLCDLCATTTLSTLAGTPSLGLLASTSAPAVLLPPPAAPELDTPWRAHRSRAPPLLLS